MPRIAIDVRMIRSSGIGVVLDNLLRRLVALRPEWSFELWGDPCLLGEYRQGNVHINAFGASIYSLREQGLGWLLAKSRPDLVWSPHYNVPLLWRGPQLVTVHDVLHLAHPTLFPGGLKQGYAHTMLGQVCKRADHIIFVSEFTRQEFGRLVGEPSGAASVIHNGVDAEFFFRPRRPPRDRPYMLLVGNIKPHKNLRRMIQAFRLIENRIPHDLVLVGRKEGFITGDGSLEDYAASPRIQFTGFIPDDLLASYYAHAALLAMPSCYEGFGLPPLEAMASGSLVLAAQTSSLPEVCGDAALYCDPLDVMDMAEKLHRLLTDDGLRARLRGLGQERVRQFRWDDAALRYLDVMQARL